MSIYPRHRRHRLLLLPLLDGADRDDERRQGSRSGSANATNDGDGGDVSRRSRPRGLGARARARAREGEREGAQLPASRIRRLRCRQTPPPLPPYEWSSSPPLTPSRADGGGGRLASTGKVEAREGGQGPEPEPKPGALATAAEAERLRHPPRESATWTSPSYPSCLFFPSSPCAASWPCSPRRTSPGSTWSSPLRLSPQATSWRGRKLSRRLQPPHRPRRRRYLLPDASFRHRLSPPKTAPPRSPS